MHTIYDGVAGALIKKKHNDYDVGYVGHRCITVCFINERLQLGMRSSNQRETERERETRKLNYSHERIRDTNPAHNARVRTNRGGYDDTHPKGEITFDNARMQGKQELRFLLLVIFVFSSSNERVF